MRANNDNDSCGTTIVDVPLAPLLCLQCQHRKKSSCTVLCFAAISGDALRLVRITEGMPKRPEVGRL